MKLLRFLQRFLIGFIVLYVLVPNIGVIYTLLAMTVLNVLSLFHEPTSCDEKHDILCDLTMVEMDLITLLLYLPCMFQVLFVVTWPML